MSLQADRAAGGGRARWSSIPPGVLTFSQRSLPLEDYLIEKFGNKRRCDDNKFKLGNANCQRLPTSRPTSRTCANSSRRASSPS